MAFKGIDFSKLLDDSRARKAMAPEDLAALEAREDFGRNAQYISRDEIARDAASSELRVIHLVDFPSSRMGMNGERTTVLYHAPKGQDVDWSDGAKNVSRAVFITPEAERLQALKSHDAIGSEAMLRTMEKGSVVTVLGEERHRRWKNERTGEWSTQKEFHAQRMGLGEMSREQLMAREPGGLADMSMQYAAAPDERAMESIARKYLGQAPAEAGSKAVSAAKGPQGLDAAFAQHSAGKSNEGR